MRKLKTSSTRCSSPPSDAMCRKSVNAGIDYEIWPRCPPCRAQVIRLMPRDEASIGSRKRSDPISESRGRLECTRCAAAMPPEDAVVLDNWFPAWARVRPVQAERPTRIRSAARFARYLSSTQRPRASFRHGRGRLDISAAGAGVSLATGFASMSGIVRSSMMHPAARAWAGKRLGCPQNYDGATSRHDDFGQ